jgi:hypothetical protein
MQLGFQPAGSLTRISTLSTNKLVALRNKADETEDKQQYRKLSIVKPRTIRQSCSWAA